MRIRIRCRNQYSGTIADPENTRARRKFAGGFVVPGLLGIGSASNAALRHDVEPANGYRRWLEFAIVSAHVER
jgi:hypothetical protein